MKHNLFITILSISFLSNFIFSQDFDESFLESLPDDVASNLEDRTKERKDEEETQYRRPSTFIEKPEPTSNRYGAQIFSMMQTSLMPTNEPNFDSSYVLDFGDELQVQLIGQKSFIKTIAVKRDGSISIEDIGKMYVAGLSLDKAAKMIEDKVNQLFIGSEAYITLTNVRDIQIILAGNVFNPGSYVLNGNSNIFHALSVSGGPSENGSFRNINLIRNNEIIETIDLYDTFIYGKSSFNARLRSGDIVFINPIQNIISITGAVIRPGIYELKKDENLSNVVFFGNGLNGYADTNNITLNRILDGRINRLPITNISQFDSILSQDGDSIFIRRYPFRSVEIGGAVLNPGVYLMNAGDTVIDVINKAGGYTDTAYPFGAIYTNLETELINTNALEKLYKDSINSISQLIKETGSEADFSGLISTLNTLKDTEPSGRVVIDLENNDRSSLLIQEEDTLFIPEITNQVYVYGSVSSQGTAKYSEGESVDYYINKKGGFVDKANKSGIFILQPNGETIKVKVSKNLFASSPSAKIKIYPGSVIYVPEEINSGYAARLSTQAYAAILGNIGVSLASLSVLKN
ncbi:SLBB domain-containing protein [Gammaproteobacteria bacterium]|nr:SLBB domain-containing protein [Gammaproteobacteria bacterium]